MAPTKQMLNRAMDAAGFARGGRDGPRRPVVRQPRRDARAREFDEIVRRDGLKAALAWRDARYDERLRDAGQAAALPAEDASG